MKSAGALAVMAAVSMVMDATATDTRLLQQELVPSTHCLDGSPAGFYFSPAPSKSTKEWVIFLEGGGACITESDCKARAQTVLGSSKDWPSSLSLPDNVLSSNCTVNPIWCNAMRVFVPYCTGDVHLGGRTSSNNDTWGLYFSGRPNFETFVSMLKERGMDEAENVLLSGCSAGGIGTYHSVDFLADKLPESRVRAAPQAGWFYPNVTFFPVWEQGKFVIPASPSTPVLWNSSGSLSQECVSAHTADPFTCFTLNGAFPYIQSEVFVGQNAADSNQIFSQLFAPTNPSSPEQKQKVVEFVEYYQERAL